MNAQPPKAIALCADDYALHPWSMKPCSSWRGKAGSLPRAA